MRHLRMPRHSLKAGLPGGGPAAAIGWAALAAATLVSATLV